MCVGGVFSGVYNVHYVIFDVVFKQDTLFHIQLLLHTPLWHTGVCECISIISKHLLDQQRATIHTF